jgi:hypothetical protein
MKIKPRYFLRKGEVHQKNNHHNIVPRSTMMTMTMLAYEVDIVVARSQQQLQQVPVSTNKILKV